MPRWTRKRREPAHLPITVNSPSPTSKSRYSDHMTSPNHNHNHSINPNSVTCTSFLMGGQYYPGKDKQRLHLRRKTLWYRIFFSSSYRRGISALVLLYILVAYCLNPALNVILHYGKILSDPNGGGGAVGEDTYDLDARNNGHAPIGMNDDVEVVEGIFAKPLHVAKKDAKKLMEKLKKIKNSPKSIAERKALLAKILPEWKEDGDENEEEVDVDVNALLKNDDDHDFDIAGDESEAEIGVIEDGLRTLANKNTHHKNFKCQRGLDELSTTLVTQTTLDRLVIMQETCKRWDGPIIAVVYLTETENDESWDDIVQDYHRTCPHLKLITYIAESPDQRKYEYPINKLRNIGLDDVVTSHVLVLDIDMIPSQGLYEQTRSAIGMAIEARMDDDGDRGLDPKDAIVIPAFERKVDPPCKTLEDCQNLMTQDPSFMPDTISSLATCIDEKDCIVFQSDVNPEGHVDTKSEEWLGRKDQEIVELPPIPCFHSQRYEPYVIVPWCALEANTVRRLALWSPRSPYYDERFYGYGKNKIQQIAHLRERGFTFHVMQTTGFVIHYPHPESETKEAWLDAKSSDLHKKMDRLYPQYLQELHGQYEGNYVETPLCQSKRGSRRKTSNH